MCSKFVDFQPKFDCLKISYTGNSSGRTGPGQSKEEARAVTLITSEPQVGH